MSSRSNGVTYCVLRSWIRSRVIRSPSCSASFTSACVTEELGNSWKRVSALCAATRAFEQNWSDAFGWLGGAGVRVRGTLGNHDVRVDGGRYEFDTLRMPARHYERSRGNLDLFVLNSNTVGDRQTAWLERRLAASTARWKIVSFHHPAYTCGGYLSNPAVVSR